MRRTLLAGRLALIITALGSAPAWAQTPYGKYPTREECEAAARKLDRDALKRDGRLPDPPGHAYYPGPDGRPCTYQAQAPAGQRWWLYAV